MFFDDLILPLRKKAVLRAPPVPETGWRPPAYYPNLSGAAVIGFDVETFDPELTTHGPGWSRGPCGHICGFSVAAIMPTGQRGKWYFPVRHTAESHDNLDPAHSFAWLKETLESPRIPKCGANLIYDMGWLTEEGIYVTGELHDVQFAEALLNEAGEVNLDHLGAKYLGAGKTTSQLYEWASQAFGGNASPAQRANIHRCPPRLVGPYAEDDADMPLDIYARQKTVLDLEGLAALFRLECDLIPMFVKMRLEGCSVDLPAAERLYDSLGARLIELQAELRHSVGFDCNTSAAADVARAFDTVGIPYARTAKGAPSFRKDFLTNLDHPLAGQINAIREHEKLRGTFIRSYILEGHTAGKIHCSFNPLRGDDTGTRTGRLSSSDPNLQNIPIRTKLGAEIRQAFIPDYSHHQWFKLDFSQIEYRFHVHFAVGPGADDVRARYCDDPTTDYHILTQQLVQLQTGRLIERKPIKNINFGLLYGMGEAKLARQLGLDRNGSKELFAAYHAGNPYTKATMQAVGDEAQALGYITTILGRRRRFTLWEPRQIDYESRAIPLPYHDALRHYGSEIQRAHTHKAINSRYQGSAADQMKAGMLALWQSGVLDEIGVPRLTVHDELDFSQRDDSARTRDAFAFVQRTMENVIPLRIPVKADCSTGINWGAAA